MGLTIHYTLSLPSKTPISLIREKLSALRQRCLDLPFEHVSDLLEFSGKYCNYDGTDDPSVRWFLIQAGEHVYYDFEARGNPQALKQPDNGSYAIKAIPSRIFGFTAQPGFGCEPANIGLRLMPKTVEVPKSDGSKGKLKVSGGWRWSSFCKTQYAGDAQTVLRCHLSVVAMLDAARELGFGVEANDEGGLYERRDVDAFLKELGHQNEMVAAFAGVLKDSAGKGVEAPIFSNPEFERLEFKGQGKIDPKLAELIAKVIKKHS